MDTNNKFYKKEKVMISEVHITLDELLGDTNDILHEEKYIKIKGLELYTVRYYVKDSKAKSTIVALHGGPAFCHNYILALKLLARNGYNVIFYDQMGCGLSTHVKDPVNDAPYLLTIDYYVEELKIVIDYYDLCDLGYYLYGSSWGTMLAQEFSVNSLITKGLKGLILDGALADSNVYITTQKRDRISTLPSVTQKLLRKLTDEKKFNDPRYIYLDENISKHFICRTLPPVDEYLNSVQLHNSAIYKLMQGESEFTVSGVFHNWSIVDRLHLIDVPVIVLAGEYDTMTAECQQQCIDNIKLAWPLVVIKNTSHCKLLEEPFDCIDVMINFLNTINSEAKK